MRFSVKNFIGIFLCSVFIGGISVEIFAEKSNQEKRDIIVENISKLSLSGYDKSNQSRLQWTLRATQGSIAPGSKQNHDSLKNASWDLQQIVLTTFSNGQQFAQMRSPAARFNPEKKSADSDAEITVRGENFSVRGKGWSWESAGDIDNLIRIKNKVILALSVPGDKGVQKISVTANSLTITGTDEATNLRFEREVIIVQGEISLKCDAITLVIPGKIKDSSFPVKSQKNNENKLAAIERITGEGQVSICTGEQTLSGDFVEYFPQTQEYSIRGNVDLRASKNNLHIQGENARGNAEKKTALITAKTNEKVQVEIGSLQAKHNADVTQIDARKLSLKTLADNSVAVVFQEEVALKNKLISIRCESLDIALNPAEQNAETSEKNLKKIVASGNVAAVSDGRELFCKRVEVLFQENKIRLLGNARIYVPEEQVKLVGEYAEILLSPLPKNTYELKKISVFGNKEQQVIATLPALSKLTKNSQNQAEENTLIWGDELTFLPKADMNTLDLSGNVKLKAETLSGSSDRIIAFAKAGKNHKKTEVKRIEARGKLVLEDKGVKITGGNATLDVNPAVTERIHSENNGSDGISKIRILVFPTQGNEIGTRPKIYVPVGDSKTFNFNLAQKKTSPKDDSKEAYIEGDNLEILIGERRTRFWLRENIVLKTEETVGHCKSIEGLLLPENNKEKNSKKSSSLKAEKIICRGDISLENSGAKAIGKTFEIFPQKDLAILSGNASFCDSQGIKFSPGERDCFIFDLNKREMLTGTPKNVDSSQVSRPKITIPRGAESSFIIPKNK